MYHNFLDCPSGMRIARADRKPGVGPVGSTYPQCGQCKDWDDEITKTRAARLELERAEYMRWIASRSR